jgi:hypothetical protein
MFRRTLQDPKCMLVGGVLVRRNGYLGTVDFAIIRQAFGQLLRVDIFLTIRPGGDFIGFRRTEAYTALPEP